MSPKPPPIQVDRAFDGEAAGEEPPSKRKRGAGEQELARAARHRFWLTSSRSRKRAASWRPRKIHRSGAKRWCTNLDMQFKVSNDSVGLAMFKKEGAADRAYGRTHSTTHMS